ncbi:MAG: PEGA domain-containing protein [Spirochaetaceae bacterium]|nr:PEGA domain-containing protein [Spirochaetaceae bacterium]
MNRAGLSGLAFPIPALLVFFLFPSGLFGLGKTEEEEKVSLNKEWVLCVTAFDVSSLPPSRQIIGNVVSTNLADRLTSVKYRFRMPSESLYYEEIAWSGARMEKGKQIASKRNERDQLLFQGNASWRYQKDIKQKDEEIKKLEEEYRQIDGDKPLVYDKPTVVLTEDNRNGTFPAAPAAGKEYRFCKTQRADAFLAGQVTEFHGRIFVNLRIYTLYSRSYSYEDSTIFSLDDISLVMDELAGRLNAAVSETAPAAIRIRVEPEDALVIIDGSFAGRGATDTLEHSPGEVEVTVSAERHDSLSLPLELSSGEMTDLSLKLRPLSLSSFTVEAADSPGSAVYRGNLYAGESPLPLDIPLGQYENISVQTPEGKTGSVVVQGGIFTGENLILNPNPSPETKQVDRFRRKFYGAYGRFWFTLPAAVLIYGISTAYTNSYNNNTLPELYNKASTYNYVSIGAIVVAGGFLGEALFRMGRYLYTTGRNETRLVK